MRRTVIIWLAALGLIAAACGGGADTGTTAAGTETTAGTTAAGGEKITINIVENAWTASALGAQIAAQIIEQELGYPTEIVKIDENTMFTGLADGSLHFVSEIWPSGIVPEEQKFLDEGSVLNIGELGTIGKIGWFVPSYVIDEHPELATWEGYKDPELAKLFATAETGDNGRFLGTDPSYSQYDEAIIDNLGLPFEVIFSGSEPATIAELDSRVAAGEPIVMYWWTPTAAVAKYNLVNVTLPEYTTECYADETAIDCDYPEDVLIKAAWSGLEEAAPDVFAFLEKFTLTTEDQLGMLPAVEIDQRPAEEVAAEWITNNESVWRAWLEG